MNLLSHWKAIVIMQKMVPKMGYLSSWGTLVVHKWPSGGPEAGQGPPEAHLSTTLVPQDGVPEFVGYFSCT